MNRLAEQQYDAVVRASRAQPRMTRAVVAGGAAAIVRELATATSSAVVLLDDTGRVLEQHPRGGGSGVLDEIRTLAAERGTVSSRVSVTPAGISISVQRIAIGSATHGHVAVVGPVLGNVDHILVGHAASLLALDFEKPARVQSAQDKLNSVALSLVLSDLDGLAPVWAQIDLAAGADGTVRAVTVDADTPSRAQRVEAAMATHSAAAGRQLFARRWSSRVTLVTRGTDDSTFAASTMAGLENSERRRLRVGISAPHPVPQLAQAVEESRLAASSAAAGADPVEFGSLVGGVLLAHASTRQALATVGDATIAPSRSTTPPTGPTWWRPCVRSSRRTATGSRRPRPSGCIDTRCAAGSRASRRRCRAPSTMPACAPSCCSPSSHAGPDGQPRSALAITSAVRWPMRTAPSTC